MSREDWLRVLDEAVDLGVEMVQFIGGEPMLHPDLAVLVAHALGRGLQVEVFSNLVHMSDLLWEVFSRPGVSLVTSYYSDDPVQYAAVTGRPSHARTRANINQALRRGIPLRAGVIDMGGGQRAEQAQAELVGLGVWPPCRQTARCGHVFARWLPIGNVLDEQLREILHSQEAERVRAELTEAFAGQEASTGRAGALPWPATTRPACSCTRCSCPTWRRGSAPS